MTSRIQWHSVTMTAPREPTRRNSTHTLQMGDTLSVHHTFSPRAVSAAGGQVTQLLRRTPVSARPDPLHVVAFPRNTGRLQGLNSSLHPRAGGAWGPAVRAGPGRTARVPTLPAAAAPVCGPEISLLPGRGLPGSGEPGWTVLLVQGGAGRGGPATSWLSSSPHTGPTGVQGRGGGPWGLRLPPGCRVDAGTNVSLTPAFTLSGRLPRSASDGRSLLRLCSRLQTSQPPAPGGFQLRRPAPAREPAVPAGSWRRCHGRSADRV